MFNAGWRKYLKQTITSRNTTSTIRGTNVTNNYIPNNLKDIRIAIPFAKLRECKFYMQNTQKVFTECWKIDKDMTVENNFQNKTGRV